jgi:hypothetical protein
MAAAKSLLLLSPPAARAVRRRRVRPSDRWELDTADGCDTAACAAFLDELEAWPRDAWLALAGRAEGPNEPAAARALDAVIAARALAVTAWLLRDLVATAAATACASACASACAAASATAERVAPARRAAERAALARLLRPWLHRGDYLALTEPCRLR